MKYFKWMFEARPLVTRIPGFVFTSIDDAIEYSKDFEDWAVDGGKPKNLFMFDGVKPTDTKQFLTSSFGLRTPPHKGVKKLSNIELNRAFDYFKTKPDDWFTYAVSEDDTPLMLSVCQTVGCIKYAGKYDKYVGGVEALYLWEATMKMIPPQQIVAQHMDD